MTTAAASFNEIATVRIELKDSDPLIWRQVEVPTSVTLKTLHDIIQATMGWFDYHLWEFIIAERRYGLPMDEDWGTEPRADASKFRLRDLLKQPNTMIDYVYDFGDNWEHRLTITNVRAGDATLSYPCYIGGERNGPPEDCGGLPGFYETLDAATDPEHPDHAEVKLWLDDYNTNKIDELPITYGLSRIANQRNAAKARLAKKKAQSPLSVGPPYSVRFLFFFSPFRGMVTPSLPDMEGYLGQIERIRTAITKLDAAQLIDINHFIHDILENQATNVQMEARADSDEAGHAFQ